MKNNKNNIENDNEVLKYYTNLYKKIIIYNVIEWIMIGIMITSLIVSIVLSIVFSTVILPTYGKIGMFSFPFFSLCFSIIIYRKNKIEVEKLKYITFSNQELEDLKNETLNSSSFKQFSKLLKLCKKAKEIYYYSNE